MSSATISPIPDDIAVGQAVERLLQAARSGVACAPVRDLLGAENVAGAYAVQKRIAAKRCSAGARIVGHKIGLTSTAVQRQLGVSQPDFGVLFDDMNVSALDEVPVGALLQPKIEAEIAFVLARDLTGDVIGARDVRSAVAFAVAALEIVDSRIAGWDISIADTVADNASSGLFVLGTQKATLDAFDPSSSIMEMTVDGEVVSKGSGAACLGDPIAALTWLAGSARDLGDPLRAGQVVLSGALGPMVPARPGTAVAATISGLGRVATRFRGE